MFNYRNGLAQSTLSRKGYYTTGIQVIQDGKPKMVTVYFKDSVTGCLDEVFEMLMADPKGLLSAGDVALMVNHGRSFVLLRSGRSCVTLRGRFNANSCTVSRLKEMAEAVAEVIDGKVVSYAV